MRDAQHSLFEQGRCLTTPRLACVFVVAVVVAGCPDPYSRGKMLKEAHSSLPFPPIFKEQRIARAAQLLGFPPSLKPHGTATDSWVVYLCNRGNPFLSALR